MIFLVTDGVRILAATVNEDIALDGYRVVAIDMPSPALLPKRPHA
jgi:hypothetical protein